MKTTIALLLLLLSALPMQAQDKNESYNLLIGTYTQPGKSEGIYVYKFNVRTGEFEAKSVSTGLVNPSFLTVSKDRKFVYAVSETDEGKVHSFLFDAPTGKLTPLNTAESGGSSPCYITVDESMTFVYTGNYGGGSLTAIPVKADGSLGNNGQTIHHEGKGLKSNQEMSHVHATVLSKDNRFLLVPDLGIDKLKIYRIDPSNSKPLQAATPADASVNPGNGPRHLTFDPSGKTAYLIQEMTGVITAFAYQDGKLKEKQSVTLPHAGFKGKIDAADVHLSPDGKFLYGSLRGDINEIVIYSINNAGKMTYVGRTSSMGKTPRNFAIDPTGNFLLVANQNSDEVVIFKRDVETGLLQNTGKKIAVGAPVCLQFAEAY